MPYKQIGNCRFYSHLTAGEAAVFDRKMRDSNLKGAIPVPGRAMRRGSQYRVVTEDPPAPSDDGDEGSAI
jgi:hypothetical protein